jgi:hypothetical protein
MSEFLPAAVPMNIIKPFLNVGIPINRVGLQIRCAITPNTLRLWKKEGPTEKNAIGERKNGPRRVCDELRGTVVKRRGSIRSRGGRRGMTD